MLSLAEKVVLPMALTTRRRWTTIFFCARSSWYGDEIAEAKRVRRKMERKWLATCLTVHWEMFKHQRNCVNRLIQDSKISHFSAQIMKAKDQKELFNLIDKLMYRTKCTKLPTQGDKRELTESFINFFSKKIADIRQAIDSQPKLAVPEYKP